MLSFLSRTGRKSNYTRLDDTSVVADADTLHAADLRTPALPHTDQDAIELGSLPANQAGIPMACMPAARNLALAERLRKLVRPREERRDLESGPRAPLPPHEIQANIYSPSKAVRNFGVVSRRTAFWGMGIASSYAASQQLLQKNLPAENLPTAMGFLYMGVPAVAVKPAYEFLEGSYKAFGKNARIYPIEALTQNHENDKAHFKLVSEIVDVPDYISRPAHAIDTLIDKDLARFRKSKPENISADELELTDRRRNWKLDYIVRRPSGVKPVEEWKTLEGRSSLDARVECALADVNESDKVFVRLLVDRVCSTSLTYQRYKKALLAPSVAEQRNATRDIEIYRAKGANFIITGNPGVGKTYTIKNVLGKAVGATVIEITIPSDEDGGFSVLLPKDWDVLIQTGFVPKPQDVLGKIIQALMEGQSENIVLYFNEVNARSALTIDGFKRLLDRTNEFIKNTPLATMFHIAPATIVIDLNPGDDNDKFLNDGAVIDRCFIHQWSPEVTISLAAKQLRAAFEENARAATMDITNDMDPYAPFPSVLAQDQQAVLNTSFETVFPKLLMEHRLTTGSARTEFVGMLIPYIANSLRRGQAKTTAEIEGFIEEHYSRIRLAQGDIGKSAERVHLEVSQWIRAQDIGNMASGSSALAEATGSGAHSDTGRLKPVRIPANVTGHSAERDR